MTATLDRVSQGRLLINVVTGGDPIENKGDGLFLSHNDATMLTREFLEIYNALLRGESVDFSGKHLQVEDGQVVVRAVPGPAPGALFRGLFGRGNRRGGATVDKYLTWGEPPAPWPRKSRSSVRPRERRGRKLSFGVRLHVIVRETAEEAWRAADKLISHLDDATIEAAQKVFERMDSVGQSRMAALHRGRRDKLEVSPNFGRGWVLSEAAPAPRLSATR